MEEELPPNEEIVNAVAAEDNPAEVQEPEQEEMINTASGEEKTEQKDSSNIMAALTALAMPGNADTFFTQLQGSQNAVQSRDRPVAPPPNIEAILRDVDLGPLYVLMMNEGNLIEIGSWLSRIQNVYSGGFRRWKPIAEAVASIMENKVFRLNRCRILRGGEEQVQQYIRQSKQALLQIPGAPENVGPEDLSWDALSFKIPPSAVEYFYQKNPTAAKTLSDEQLSVINELEDIIYNAIKEKCAEFRARTNTVEDEFLPDCTLFLEQQVGGMIDPDRSQRISNIGRGMLISYVSKMKSLFMTGNLPSTLQPGKIYACHDIISAGELRGSILRTSEMQVTQQSTILQNKRIISRAYQQGQGQDAGGRDWTAQQQASLKIKQNTDTFMRRSLKTLGQKYDNPMGNLDSQLAGSSNTLGQQMQSVTGDAVVRQNEMQEEISKNELSVLLSCLRMRFNAVQQSDWELVPDEDLDHLEIVKFLAHQVEDVTSGQDVLFKTAAIMAESIANGHNVVKFQGKMLPEDLYSLITYTLQGRAKTVLQQIPFFDADIREGGSAFSILMYCVISSLAQRQRIVMESQSRASRKAVAQMASSSIY